jgi:hypothetical protein
MIRLIVTDNARRWAIAVAFAFAIVAMLVFIATSRDGAPPHTHDRAKACLEAAANDEHASLEAFFQNPAGQDALRQASIACSK